MAERQDKSVRVLSVDFEEINYRTEHYRTTKTERRFVMNKIDKQELEDYLGEGKISESLKNAFTVTSGQFQGDERVERVRFRPDETDTGKPKAKRTDDYER